ncbi:uncharacterized protein BX664DRAFT_60079 [Halteromyces radiatus]|uniref:uncharacterized protein n=1 Tax=Halteromyces radiatus TaxID=101107 RepID=UPI00221FA43C|nr:uncharacterized protein BX664DRAFT_60079 [Halteromyces radiatus]KAI8096478.1 hypothetical protein BX664DRAFT_60079 [Halteromyces radiatus]
MYNLFLFLHQACSSLIFLFSVSFTDASSRSLLFNGSDFTTSFFFFSLTSFNPKRLSKLYFRNFPKSLTTDIMHMVYNKKNKIKKNKK